MASKSTSSYVAGTTLTSTGFQKAVKDSVVPVVFEMGISNIECVQIDSYKWILKTLVQGVPAYAELSLTAKKPDFGEEELTALESKYAEKVEKANDREVSRATKRAEKSNSIPRNSSGNLLNDGMTYEERYEKGAFPQFEE